jgi:hypothetical protein
MEPECSLPLLQKFATGQYPELAVSSPHLHKSILQDLLIVGLATLIRPGPLCVNFNDAVECIASATRLVLYNCVL